MKQYVPRFVARGTVAAIAFGVMASAPVLRPARAQQQPGSLVIRMDQPGHPISPQLYGLMTEEINHSYDGGLYAELIQNRTFLDSDKGPSHWSLIEENGASGALTLNAEQPVNAALPRSLKLEIKSDASAGSRVGVANDGYWGVPVKPRTRYRASFWARAAGGFTGPVTAGLESADGKTVYATARTGAIGPEWRRYEVTLNTSASIAPTTAGRFTLSANRPGTVYFSLVSLFPPTFKNRANGNRPDLMDKMSAMNPKFLRLPGGNYLEGNRIADRFPWQTTLGPISERPGHPGTWGYRASDGMGFLEMLLWCEDLKVEPLLGVFAGYALNGEHVAAGPGLTPFVQEALDEIEYVTGDVTTKWGARRATDGHPAPFPLRYVEIGNEDWFDRSGSYNGRWAQFYDAIKTKYPRLQLIATMPVTSRKPDLLDEHFYRSASAMAMDSDHYDAYDRNGPKIFVGEWASMEGSPTPTFRAALGDAAWMTGMERNSDIVALSAYAPLLVNVNAGASQWATNLIGYDNASSFGSPSYYAQALFGKNVGDTTVPVELRLPIAPQPAPHGRAGVGTWRTQAEYKNIIVRQGDQTLYRQTEASRIDDWKTSRGMWQAKNGVLRQTRLEENVEALVGDSAWADYSLQFQARKTGGSEGFLAVIHFAGDDNKIWWNIGGWNNARTSLQSFRNGAGQEFGPRLPLTIETGRWYDVRVDVAGRAIKCYLDGKLVAEAEEPPLIAGKTLFVVASRDRKSGEVIVKAVNTGPDAQTLEINFAGARSVARRASGEILTGDPAAQNSLAEPEKIAPQPLVITNAAPRFSHAFPAHSVTVLRFKAR